MPAVKPWPTPMQTPRCRRFTVTATLRSAPAIDVPANVTVLDAHTLRVARQTNTLGADLGLLQTHLEDFVQQGATGKEYVKFGDPRTWRASVSVKFGAAAR